MSDTHAQYLRYLGKALREAGEQSLRDVRAASPGDKTFEQGRRMAYFEVLSLMEDQARAFNLPPSDLSFDGFAVDEALFGS